MIHKQNWEASTSQERIPAIEEIKKTIIRTEGYIINFNMFSDLALSLSIEIEECHIPNLHHELQKIITLSDLDSTELNPQSKKEWMAESKTYLFLKDEIY
jgi:hypothetical protein